MFQHQPNVTMSEKKIGILYVLDNLAIGGAQQVVLTLAENLDKKKFHIVVCTLFSRDTKMEEPLADEIKEMDIPVYKLAMTSWRDWNTIKKLLQITDMENIDLVHSHMVPADFWGSLLSKMLGRKLGIYTRHNTYTPSGFSSKLQTFLLNHIFCEKIVAISDATFENLVDKCWANPQKIVKIYNGVNTKRFLPSLSGTCIRESLDIPPNSVVVGNLSRFEKRKGLDVLLHVASQVTKIDTHVRFLIMGYGPEEVHLHALAKQLQVEKYVIFVKPRRNVPEFLAAIDILLFTPYWGEGLPTVILEAMASGKPVVASNIGSNRELVVNGMTGFLPSPEVWAMETTQLDASAFTEEVVCLIRNRDHAIKMGMEGRKVVEQNFSVEKMIQETEALYFDLIKHG